MIAAIDGPAVGMGAEFTLQCDVRIATTRARIAWNFPHRGLVPDTGAGTWLLPRVVEPDQLMDAAREEARRYLAVSPLSLRLIKQLTYEGLERPLAEHMAEHLAAMGTCFASEDHKEGVAAFLERRPAKFVGR